MKKDREQILRERNFWYGQTYILFEIVKCLKNRELCFLTLKSEEKKKAVRYLLGFNIDYLKKHMAWFNTEKGLLNIYHSVALLKPTVPVFSYNLKVRSRDEKYEEFNKNYSNYVEKYNFFLDIDGKEDFKLALKEAKEIKKIFDEFKIPYYILNSSFWGFHFVIPSEYMPDLDIIKLLETLNELLYNFIGIHDFKMVDETIVDLKRVQKCPYSYSCDGSIVLPLDDKQLQNFKQEMVVMQTVLKDVRIKDRGLLLRTHNLSKEELKKNVLKFIESYE